MSLKIHTEVETLYWQPHKIQLSGSGAISARKNRVTSSWDFLDIVADSTGYWVSFQDLNRFRGGVYRYNTRFSRTRTIDLGSSGPENPRLLAGNPSGGYWVYDDFGGQIHRYNSSWGGRSSFEPPSFSYEGDTYAGYRLHGMDFDSDGDLWFITDAGLLAKYDTSSRRVDESSIVSLYEVISSEPFFFGGQSLTIDDGGDFWILDGRYIHRLSGSNRIEIIDTYQSLQNQVVLGGIGSEGGNLYGSSLEFTQGGDPRHLIWAITVPKPQIPALQLAPRYLKMMIVQSGRTSILGTTQNETETPQRILSVLEAIFRQGLVREVEIFTAHLLTFNNLDVEDREGYSNSLLAPPVVTESLPSLTSGMTSFGGISISIAAPSMRRFFDGSETETTTQNPVRIYRSVCGKRSLIWNGFLDGIGISAAHQTTLSCRPIMKKFEQLADFGFADKSAQWKNHGFLMPIVACKLIPWTVKTASHSPIGTETYSMLGERFAGGSFTTDAAEDIDGAGSSRLTTFRYRDYARSLGAMMQAPYEGLENFRGTNRFGSEEVFKPKKENNSLAKEHLNIAKKPTYVSFSKSEIPNSVMTIEPNGGAMSFQRGIFFAPTEREQDAYSRFYVDHTNYVPSPIPLGARAVGVSGNFVSQPGFERFFLGGSGQISPFRSGDWRNIQLSDLKQGMRVRSVTEGGLLVRTRQGVSQGYDSFALFPSLNLGDSYCNWTHVPVPFENTEDRFDSTLDRILSGFDFGARRFPPTNGGYLPKPIVTYIYITDYDYSRRPSYSNYFDPPVPHPLDSFFRATYVGNPTRPEIEYYFKATMYTPHQVGLTYFGRKGWDTNSDVNNRIAMEPEYYFFTQWCTYTSINPDSFFRHEDEIQRYHSKVALFSSSSSDRNKRVLWIDADGDDDETYESWISMGEYPYPMARCKDMYTTEQSFENDQKIRTDELQMIIPLGNDTGLSYKSVDTQIDSSWKSGARSNMRVMPAYPRRISATGKIQNSYPILDLEGRESGAFYVTAEYLRLRDVGYWDTNWATNRDSHVNSIDNFRGHYHHHRQRGMGVSPYNFLYAIVKSAGFEPDWDIDATDHEEMTSENPMQILSNTGQTYKSLIDRTCPGIGKTLRWDPTQNKVEIIDWLSAHRDASRSVAVLYDENCLRFDGLTSSSASIPSSFTFENPDILKGENTLEGFSDENKLLGRYVRITSSIFIQGKAATIQTGTWHEDAAKGLGIYNQISDILGYRVNIVSFTVGTEVLLGAGPLGTISVGSWVRLVSPAFSQGVADLFIVETTASELATSFRAYRFLGVGIQDIADNTLPVGSPPADIGDIPGDDSPPDDEGLTDGADVLSRAYY